MAFSASGSPGVLSDKSLLDRKSAVTSKLGRYSDLDLSLYLDKNLTKGDIVPLEDIDAVKNSVRNLVLQNYYDRPFQPFLGANLRGLLFEPADQFTVFAINASIKLLLKEYEPRIDQITIKTDYNDGEDQYNLTLAFRVITQNKPVDMTIRLVRLR